jgi:hypothetical protein
MISAGALRENASHRELLKIHDQQPTAPHEIERRSCASERQEEELRLREKQATYAACAALKLP